MDGGNAADFSLGRKNILSFGDAAIQNGLKRLYGHKKITPALAEKYHKRYSRMLR